MEFVDEIDSIRAGFDVRQSISPSSPNTMLVPLPVVILSLPGPPSTMLFEFPVVISSQYGRAFVGVQAPTPGSIVLTTPSVIGRPRAPPNGREFSPVETSGPLPPRRPL